jgi:hypothetical protein
MSDKYPEQDKRVETYLNAVRSYADHQRDFLLNQLETKRKASAASLWWLVPWVPMTLLLIWYRAFTLKTLWNWYLTPEATMRQAVGLVLVVGLLVHQRDKKPDEEKSYGRQFFDATIFSLVLSSLMLGTGWLMRLF